MEKIIVSYESHIDLSIFTVVGEITFDDIWDKTLTFFSGKSSTLVLCDFTQGITKFLSSEELEKIAELGMSISPKIEGGKAAILAPKDIDFGMARIFEVFSEMKNFPLKVMVFRDIRIAINWLVT